MTDYEQDLKNYQDSCERIAQDVNSANQAMKNILPKIENSLQLADSINEMKNDIKKLLNAFKTKFRQFENNQLIRNANRTRFQRSEATFEWLYVRILKMKQKLKF